MKTTVMDTNTSLQDSDREAIPVSAVHDLYKIHNNLDKAVSKWVGNAAHILAFLSYSASRQHYEV